MQRLVALKISLRLGDEPATLSQFDHPHIVRVFDQRQLQDPPWHLLYMQYLPGGTLADVQSKARRVEPGQRTGNLVLESVDEQLLHAAQSVPDDSEHRRWLSKASWSQVVCRYTLWLAEALQQAHQVGVLHRDVKPANILLSATGLPKLADFNVSHRESGPDADVAFGGTLSYMSPEHLRAADAGDPATAADLDARSDLYSLAVVAWELWTGARPFHMDAPENGQLNDQIQSHLKAQQNALPALPSREDDATGEMLEETLRECLQEEPAARPESAQQLAGRLRLAMDPIAASLFRPPARSLSGLLGKVPFWILIVLSAVVPNALAAVFNFVYVNTVVIPDLEQTINQVFFKAVFFYNLIAFSVGLHLFVQASRGCASALQRSRDRETIDREDYRAIMHPAPTVAHIGIAFWIIAGVFYSAMLWMFSDLMTGIHILEVFLSHVICGLVACAFPYLMLAWISCYLHYPRLAEVSMHDDHAADRFGRMVGVTSHYVLVAAGVPSIGLLLLVINPTSKIVFAMVTAIVSGGAGLVMAFAVYRAIARAATAYSRLFASNSIQE